MCLINRFFEYHLLNLSNILILIGELLEMNYINSNSVTETKYILDSC